MPLNRHLQTLIAVICLCWASVVWAAPDQNSTNDPQKVQAQLKKLEADIAKFQKMLNQTKGQKAELENQLEQNEKNISNLMKQIDTIQKKLKAGKKKISDLKVRQQDLEQAKTAQQALVARQVRAAWRMGNQQYLKVVLNQEDPNRISRMLTYYDYINRARAQQIKTYRDTIASLEQVRQQITSQNEALAANRISLKQQESALQTTQAKRHQTLLALNREIVRTGTRISSRIKDKKRLEALLDQITQSIDNLPTPGDTMPFAKERGKLLMPVAGRIIDHYGESRNNGKLRWDGIFIAAAAGTPVKAIHYGRVVFSDWLRGFGLLLIIDHGDGYMSLYGHNQVLYREVGDWVTAGETIATVGSTGGQTRPGLYFEIRHKGKPTNPQRWCRARSAGHA